jgi:hypothetical protein
MTDTRAEGIRGRTPGERGMSGEEVVDGLTGRAFLIGLALCLFLAVAIPYNRMVIQGTSLHFYFVDRGVLFVFLCLILLVNVVLKPEHTLKRGELLCIFSMLLVSMPTLWMVKWLIAFLTGMTYYASPERPDLEAVLPHVLPWTAPRNASAVRGFYEGLPQNVPLPWLAWLAPLASWGSFFLVLFGVLICIAVIFRRQWAEHERFAFPILQVPLEMAKTGSGRLGPLFRNRLMWAGFSIPFLIGMFNGLNHYFHTLPRIRMGTMLRIFQGTTSLPLRLHFAILGYSYFVNLDVSLSIWLFNVISKVIRGMLAVVGAEYSDVSGMVGRFSSRGSSFLALTGMGYMLVLAAYSAWTARGHLRGVFARALGRPSNADDSDEVISYRAAVLGALAGLVYLGCWLNQAGISVALISFLFFFLYRGVFCTGPDCERDGIRSHIFADQPRGVCGLRDGFLCVQPGGARDARVQLRLDNDAGQQCDAPRSGGSVAVEGDEAQTRHDLGDGRGDGGWADYGKRDDAGPGLCARRPEPGPALPRLFAHPFRCLCGDAHAGAESRIHERAALYRTRHRGCGSVNPAENAP